MKGKRSLTFLVVSETSHRHMNFQINIGFVINFSSNDLLYSKPHTRFEYNFKNLSAQPQKHCATKISGV